MKKVMVVLLCVAVLLVVASGCSQMKQMEGIWMEYGDDGDLDWSLEITGTDASYQHHYDGRVIGSEDLEVVEKDDGIWLVTYKYGVPAYKFRLEVSGDTLTMYYNSGNVCSVFERY